MTNERRSPDVPQFDVVAVGASAGGVEALHVVVEALPVDFPAPVLIVQHMDPRHRGEPIESGTVYIAQPDAHLLVRDGRLLLTDQVGRDQKGFFEFYAEEILPQIKAMTRRRRKKGARKRAQALA